jgi:hypothetical protein
VIILLILAAASFVFTVRGRVKTSRAAASPSLGGAMARAQDES